MSKWTAEQWEEAWNRKCKEEAEKAERQKQEREEIRQGWVQLLKLAGFFALGFVAGTWEGCHNGCFPFLAGWF